MNRQRNLKRVLLRDGMYRFPTTPVFGVHVGFIVDFIIYRNAAGFLDILELLFARL